MKDYRDSLSALRRGVGFFSNGGLEKEGLLVEGFQQSSELLKNSTHSEIPYTDETSCTHDTAGEFERERVDWTETTPQMNEMKT